MLNSIFDTILGWISHWFGLGAAISVMEAFQDGPKMIAWIVLVLISIISLVSGFISIFSGTIRRGLQLLFLFFVIVLAWYLHSKGVFDRFMH